MLHPDFPVVDGRHSLTKEWSLFLDQPHSRRVEDGSLVLWRPGFTVWLNIWNNDKNQSKEERLTRVISDASKAAFDITSKDVGKTKLYYYRIDEDRGDKVVPSLNGFSISPDNDLQISIYFDSEEDYASAKSISESIEYQNH